MGLNLRSRLQKSSDALAGRLAVLFRVGEIGEDDLDRAEEILLEADMGWELTEHIISQLPRRVLRSDDSWREVLAGLIMEKVPVPASAHVNAKPGVTVLIGVNGAGKTTTLARLAAREKENGRTVLLACADTFRAAAAEQLTVWAEKLDTAVLTQLPGSDSAAVAFDAVKRGVSRNYDAVMIDTAGRLPNKRGLLEELAKIHRVCGKAMESAPHEVLLVLDGTVGQNAEAQARQFMKAMPVTGLVVTKLDGTARGGSVLAMAGKLGIPVKYIGVGEGSGDLVDFVLEDYVRALLGMEDS